MLLCEHCQQQHTEAHRYCPITGRLVAPHRFFPPGTVLDGKYRLRRVLGAGGMGAVFEVTHELLDKRMAAKVMLPEISRDREMAARMAREAQIASSTGHPNVVQVTDMGWTADGAMYLIMELLEGRTLTEIIRTEAPLPVRRAAGLLDQLLAGLGAVHRQGVVHRDLKPDNIIVVVEEQRERLKILDFGISKVLDDQDLLISLTNTGMILGTPHYMAPEQARGARDLDHRADLYAAGVLLYTMLCAQRPLEARGYNEMIALILEGKIAPPSTHAPGISGALDGLVLNALARDPANRYADAQAFREALAPFMRQAPAAPAPAAPAVIAEREPPAPPAVIAEGQPPAPPAIAASERDTPAAAAEPAAPFDPRFAPPVEPELPLELATVDGRGAPRAAPAEVGTFFDPQPRARVPVGWLLALAVIAVAAIGAWLARDTLFAAGAHGPRADGTILLLVNTTPADADVYVDGALQHSKPVELPRSERAFTIRVERRGYLTKTFQVRADRTRSLQVTLRRQRRR